MVLYINSCVRDESRTDKLARALLKKLGEEFTELYLLDEGLAPLDKDLLNKRTELIEKGDFSDPMFRYAKQFASADKIVISAPFWDFSFPSVLKVYLENIYVTGLVSEYGPDGMPRGLCRAQKLYYVTTAGGPFVGDFSFGYWKALAEQCFGIKSVELIKAEMLDIVGADADKIISDAIAAL
jgi:FMN-dependent NADH-azoreductase